MNRLAFAALFTLGACTCPAPSAAVEPKLEQVKRPRGDTYAIALLARGPYTVGKAASVAFTVTAKAGFHVNPEYPVVFKPQGHSGVAFSDEHLRLVWGSKTPCADRTDEACAVELAIPLVPEKSGQAVVAGKVAFSVCSKQGCELEKLPVTLNIDVN